MFKTLQAFLLHKKNIYSENSISIEKNGVKLQLIKEIQISRHKAIYGQTLGELKRENNCDKLTFFRHSAERNSVHLWWSLFLCVTDKEGFSTGKRCFLVLMVYEINHTWTDAEMKWNENEEMIVAVIFDAF